MSQWVCKVLYKCNVVHSKLSLVFYRVDSLTISLMMRHEGNDIGSMKCGVERVGLKGCGDFRKALKPGNDSHTNSYEPLLRSEKQGTFILYFFFT